MAEQQVQPLHNEKHANIKVKNGVNVDFLKTQHLMPVVAHEFARVATEFPMAFVKNTESGQFQAVAMFGLQPGENLFVDGDKWTGSFVPMAAARYPFGLVKHPEQDQFGIVIDEASPLVGEEEGNALFEDGKETKTVLATQSCPGGWTIPHPIPNYQVPGGSYFHQHDTFSTQQEERRVAYNCRWETRSVWIPRGGSYCPIPNAK